MADLEQHLRQVLSVYEPERIAIEGFRPAAVLVPLLKTEQGIELLFTVRSSALKHHAGQISFPGGRADEGETFVETAIRETHEETGLIVHKQNVLGFLDEHPSPAQYIVTPVVALLDWPQALHLNKHEVAEVFTAPLTALLNLDPGSEERQVKAFSRRLHYYHYGERVIWGLTGNVLKRLLDLVRTLESP